MSNRMLFSGIVCICSSWSNIALGTTIVENDNMEFYFGESFDGDYELSARIYQDVGAGNPTGVVFKYDRGFLEPYVTNVDEGSDWFLVEPGNAFSRESIEREEFPVFFNVPGPTGGEPIFVGTGEFYLGVRTSDKGIRPEERDIFGWARIRHTEENMLEMVENVVSYDSPGIIVGTTRIVPEPNTLTLAAMAGMLWLNFRRRARKHQTVLDSLLLDVRHHEDICPDPTSQKSKKRAGSLASRRDLSRVIHPSG